MTDHLKTIREALEAAQNGLKWYRDAHPEDDSGADDEMEGQITEARAAINALGRAMREQTALIVRGCCEAEKADPDRPDTICISVQDLISVVECFAAPPAQQAQPSDFADAYQGAMEEVAIWKRRALEAEELNRKFMAEINGATFMGEPAQQAQPTSTHTPCKGMNCGITSTDQEHSRECQAEHAAAIAGGSFVKQAQRPDFHDEWAGYLKDGETPFERFRRERKDLDALTKLYQRALEENEQLKAQQAQPIKSICTDCRHTDSWGLPDSPHCNRCEGGKMWEPLNTSSVNPNVAQQEPPDDATIAGLESSIGILSTLVDEQRQLLGECEAVFGRDDLGLPFEDGDSALIDRVRAHLAATNSPTQQAQAEAVPQREVTEREHNVLMRAMVRGAKKVEAPQQAEAVQQPDALVGVPEAMNTVITAMQADPDYAWSWHCNVAMAFVDAGGDPYTANQGAARFMRLLANVDPAHELPTKQAEAVPPGYAGVMVWIGDNQVVRAATETEIRREREPGFVLKHAALMAVAAIAAAPQPKEQN